MSGAARATEHLLDPPPPAQLHDFPTHTYPAKQEFLRSHATANGAWWFASAGEGRFDLGGANGTCYVAEDSVITLLEKFGGQQIVPSTAIQPVSIASVLLWDDLVVADLTSNKSIAFGVTAEIFTTSNYELTQKWASALQMAGFAGLRYWARHDLTHAHAAIAIFDSAGQSTSTRHHVVGTKRLADCVDLLNRWHDETGVTVLPVPSF